MANKLALGLVIGGAVSSSVGSAFKDVDSRIKKLEATGAKARVMQRQIGDTIRLRNEWKKAYDSGSAGAYALRNKLNANLDSLRKQGIEVGRLDRAYQMLGRTARQADLKAQGHAQLNEGRASVKSTVGRAAVGAAALAVPTKVSADYNAIIRDIAIKAGIANAPEEKQMSRTIIDTSRDTGMARNEVATVVNELVGAGMDLAKAMEYAPVAAKFVIGQGSDGGETAKMINALGQNANITSAKEMQQALEAIAFQGQAGSFEASDMAKWFPELLANMGNLRITGMDAVTQLGAMLQVQMKTAGSSDEAANNLKNWMGKIGSSQTVESYAKVGIDYQGSLESGIQQGMSTLESSFALAQKYIQKTDPKRAAEMAEATAKISKESNPEKAKAMMASLEQALRTGDIFADMQVKAALTAYMQNKELYGQLKRESRDATGILDKNLAERRETSSQKWKEMAQSMDDAMRSVGDAIRPITDGVAEGLTSVAKGITSLSDRTPGLAMGLTVLAGGALTLQGLLGSFKIGKGLFNLARGAMGGRDAKGVQKVFVTNAGDGDDKEGGKGSKVLALAEIGLKAFGGKKDDDGDSEEGGESKGFDPIDTGLKLLDVFREAKNDDDGGEDTGPQKVFVVNAAAMGGGGGGGGAGGRGGRRRAGGRNGRRRAGGGGPRPPRPPVPPVPPVPPGRAARAMGLIGKAGKAVPGAALFEGVLRAADTYQNAETKDEKAEGYGAAAGNMAGALAGAAAGAAIGSVVPILGTAVGGLIGGILGSMGGESIGGSLGKSWFGSDDEKPAEPPKPEAKAAGEPLAPVVKPVSYDPTDPDSKDPFLLPHFANKPRFPGADLVRPDSLPPPTASPAPVVKPVSYDPADPDSKNPFLLPHFANKPRFPGADLVRPKSLPPEGSLGASASRELPGAVNMGDVVRSFASTAPAGPLAMPPKVEPVLKVEPPKIDQKIDVSAPLTITVQGDVKDPAALARELQPHLQRQIEQINQQMSSRNLYDQPHL
ncbi:phage tail tape measure protein [Pseudomonas lundensis]|uniref:phage tail tape measure protein n=1 Tax=Pseudomonas lundensis TaxID=86185 RepID=UPI0018913852|nr:phage tail tape measure protein [Pseudomonas lundensis]QOF90724.1 phage tail tape measure protein [Pseudomonas lundensis]